VNKVILIGDSIRMGYQEIVQQELANEADVWAPTENGGTSQNVLAHLDEWVLARDPDIVHLNCGLHDLRRAFGETTPSVPIAEYRANLEEIFRRILGHTSARLIWATTTPVNEEWHHARKGFDRFEADVTAYNRESQAIAARFGVTVDDLFQTVVQAGRDEYLQPDGVHFTQPGYVLLGQAVAAAIRAAL
jgi:lysophospholipase L1-like esterase